MKKIINFLKTVTLFLLREIASFFIKATLLAGVIAILIFSIYKYQQNKKMNHFEKDYSYVEIDLGVNYSEKGQGMVKNFLEPSLDYWTLLNSLKKMEKDESLMGVLVKTDNLQLNPAQIQEVGEALEKVGMRKKVYMHSTGWDRNSYLLGTYGETLVMPGTASATSNLTGYNVDIPYFKRILEKILIQIAVINIGDYKSFGENFIAEEMSSYAKENTETILEEKFNYFVETVAEKRKIEKETLRKDLKDGIFASVVPNELLKNNLIDSEEFYYELKKDLSKDKIIDLNDYIEIKTEKENAVKDKLGVIVLSGEISETLGVRGEGITSEKTIALLEKAFKNESIKGVVLRIDSPGGSALTSEIIHNMLIENKNKPVYISVGGVAASGGYYIATGGDKIYFNKESVTGSIGVVSLIPDISKLKKKIGIDSTVLKNGELGNLYSISEPMDAKRKEVLQKSNLAVYKEFKQRVATARKMGVEEVEKIAGGRVYLGESAVKINLGDGIKTFEEVVDTLAQNLNLETYEIEIIDEEDLKQEIRGYLGFFGMKNIFEKFSEKIYKPMFIY
ncbi:MAG: S49 family peptidase [Fusobacteriaceae bacterium]